MFKLVAILLISIVAVNCEYTKLNWSDCGSKNAKVVELDITPMPIVQPGTAKLKFKGSLALTLEEGLEVQLDIKRTISGLTLPIRCYKVAGVDVGSCKYSDLCQVVKTLLPTFSPAKCPASIAKFGIDCTCPMKIQKGIIEVNEDLVLPDAESSIATFLAAGDFDIKIATRHKGEDLACVRIGFSVKSAKKP